MRTGTAKAGTAPEPGSGRPILDGVRIMDMTSVIFGPYCTSILASMGAEVVKLEPAHGDELRRVGRPRRNRGMGPAHLTLNAGKRAVAWNIRTAEGKERLLRRIADSQVFIHNLRPEAAQRAGLDHASLSAGRADLILVTCSGYDSRGPLSGRPAYDDVIQAASGAASLLPRIDGNPQPRYLPMAIADKVAGLYAANAVLAALAHRAATGQGCEVEVPMFESFTHFLLQDHLYGAALVDGPEGAGYPRQLDAERQPMATLDGYVTIAPYTDERWVRFFAVAGASDFLDRHELGDARSRFAGLHLMQAEMARLLRNRTTAEWLDLCARHDIPASHVASLDEILNDPQLAASEFFRIRHHPSEGPYREMRLPIRFTGHPEAERIPARSIGEDDDLIS
ncbi:CaiB/BaiF CoA-transferase family protein [Paracoccus sp. J55]|uniref:CaiB/BaiF CoA transferase family protein n=1 Tax=Paracoccus sp. J55 TaxID=935849 RepID=UPI0006888A4A|nr:CoA transferase [Paracoccus sp. J55]